eukprot:10810770-Prorocentrum_lima.AAC.1
MFPWGRPDISPKDTEKVQQGNATMQATLKLVAAFHKLSIPWVVEHPATSKAWYLPEVQALLRLPGVRLMQCDFCQYGSRWRKRTRFMCGHIDHNDLQRLSRQCSGKGVCSRTGRPHIQLTGSGPGGVPWTRIAQPYPGALCHHLAHCLTSH